MTIRSDEAAAMLADVDSVVAKVKQSRIYRSAALIIIPVGRRETSFATRWSRAPAQSARAGSWSTRSELSARSPFFTGQSSPARAFLEDVGGVLPVLCLRLDLGEFFGRIRFVRTDGVLADAAPVRLRARWPLVRCGVFGDRAWPHSTHSHEIRVGWDGLCAVACARDRGRIHSVRPLDAAGLSHGRSRRGRF